ncbi:uncharacterized protein (TIGR02231 family) [Mucilaginibacter oryzae]|uniref:Uncharacterized protein (TIGR02231 family) n=2 Tax=Mucilaginibacter oryzae TaxID=468058 RepID=A0A316HJN6_9SPHI|nr:uncharacterized protein (TIGR02231 family) [Mucilaginibacter oryzae]
MLKKLTTLTTAILLFIAPLAKADEEQKMASKVQKVTVFLNGAQVNRTAQVNVAAGNSTLIFDGLSPDIDVQSIQVNGAGDFTILSVKHELDFLKDDLKQKQVEDIREQQRKLRDKIALQTDLISIYQQEADMLSKNQQVGSSTTGLDVLKLKQALDFQTARLTAIKLNQQTANNQIRELNTELAKYDKQIASLSHRGLDATSNILVTVSSKTALQATFTLNYVVKTASWFPTYDIRAKNANSPIVIAYKANVSQKSGEDWKNVKLTLSTGNPTVSGSKPTLAPYYVGSNMYYAGDASITRVAGIIVDEAGTPLPGVTVKVKGTSIGAVSDVSGNYSIQVPGGNPVLSYSFVGYETAERSANTPLINVSMKPFANALNEVVVVGYGTAERKELTGAVSGIKLRGTASKPIEVTKAENQTNIEFNIANPYSVPSDGKQYAVEISQYDIEANYQYYVAPKLSTDVFLTAQLINWNKYSFLSGEASLFFEGTYIGKSLINTDATTDTLNLSLGVDKNIIVTRTLAKELSARQSFGSNKKETRDWQIDIKNRKNQQVNLLVEDQLPVSQNKDIEVEAQEVSAGKVDATTGKVSWNFMLNSQEGKKLRLKYQVKYPKDQSVIVQ